MKQQHLSQGHAKRGALSITSPASTALLIESTSDEVCLQQMDVARIVQTMFNQKEWHKNAPQTETDVKNNSWDMSSHRAQVYTRTI